MKQFLLSTNRNEVSFHVSNFHDFQLPTNLQVITTGPGKPQGNHPFPPSPSAVQLSKGACHRGDQQIIATLSNDLNPSIWAPTTVYGEKLYQKISVSLVVVDIYLGKLLYIIPTSELVGLFGVGFPNRKPPFGVATRRVGPCNLPRSMSCFSASGKKVKNEFFKPSQKKGQTTSI